MHITNGEMISRKHPALKMSRRTSPSLCAGGVPANERVTYRHGIDVTDEDTCSKVVINLCNNTCGIK